MNPIKTLIRFSLVMVCGICTLPLAAQVDQDQDGMPDDWEQQVGLNANDPNDAFGDADGDQILNLQEYILDLDPTVNNESLIYEYDPNDPIEDLYEFLFSNTAIVRIPQGTYDFEYFRFWNPNHRIMIQGGWSSDFSEYDPCLYKTKLKSSSNSVLVFFGPSDYSGVVIDGFEFMSSGGLGSINLTTHGHPVDYHIHNCTFGNSQYGADFAALYNEQHTNITLSNSLFYNCSGAGVRVITENYATCDMRIINCTFHNPSAEYGGINISHTDPTNKVNIFIKNSILWENGEKGAFSAYNLGVIRENVLSFEVENSVFKSNTNRFDITVTNPITDTPVFVDAEKGNFELADGSPLIDRGDDIGLPFTGTAIDIGAVEKDNCPDCTLSVKCSATPVSTMDATDGIATVLVEDGAAPFTYNWDNGATEEMLLNLSSGTYKVTVLDANDCIALCHIRIPVAPTPAPDLDGDNLPDVLELDYLDTDEDGIADVWEEAAGLNPRLSADAFCDNDGDQVLNLFEFQLGTNPNDVNDPPKYQVTPATSNIEFGRLIKESDNQAIYIRMAEGTYDYSYKFNDKHSRLLIQGGWNSTFEEYDPVEYATVVRPAPNERNIFTFGYHSSLANTFIIDGLQITGGQVPTPELPYGLINLNALNNHVYYSIYNSSFYNNQGESIIKMRALEQVQKQHFYLLNTTIVRNDMRVAAIEENNLSEGTSNWKILNSTITDNGASAKQILIKKQETESIQNIDLQNAIIWSKNQEKSIFFQSPLGLVNLDYNRLVSQGIDYKFEGASFNLIENGNFLFQDPPLINGALAFPELRFDSPYLRKGRDVGLPYSGILPNIGYNRGGRLNLKKVETNHTDANCGSHSGTITFLYNGLEKLEYSIDGINYFLNQHFQGLNNGTYDLYVRQNACEYFIETIELEDNFINCGKDTDKDGMKDKYELANGFDPNDPTDGLGDSDCDAVLNLFEYMLGSDPYDAASPEKHVFLPTQSREDLDRLIVRSQEQPMLIQLIEGHYENFSFEDQIYFNGPYVTGWKEDANKRLLIQGGWKSDLTEYNPFCYTTQITYDKYFFRVSTNKADSMVLLLDGLSIREVDDWKSQPLGSANSNGRLLRARNWGGVVNYGVNNCSFIDNRSVFSFRLDLNAGPFEMFVINSTFADNRHHFDLALPNGKPDINFTFINATLIESNRDLNVEKGFFELQKVGTDTVNIRVVNSIFMDASYEHSLNIFPDKRVNLEVYNSVFSDGNASEFISYQQEDVIRTYPELQQEGHHFKLPANSPLKAAGRITGIPFDISQSGPDIGVNTRVLRLEEPEIEDTYCTATDGYFLAKGCYPGAVEYSIDQINWTQDPLFKNLAVGDYMLTVRTSDCTEEVNLPVRIENLDSDLSVTCMATDGVLRSEGSGGVPPYRYQWNTPAQDTTEFISLTNQDIYTVTITDEVGCTSSCQYVYEDNCENPIVLELPLLTPTSCGVPNGKIEILQSFDSLTTFSLDGMSFGKETVFENLDTGSYVLYVLDTACAASIAFTIDAIVLPTVNINNTTPTTCISNDGTVQLNGEGGAAPYEYILQEEKNRIGSFSGLAAGSYEVVMQDSLGCEDSIMVIIELAEGRSFDKNATQLTPTSCGLDNGKIELFVKGATTTYDLFLEEEKVDLINENLVAGSYQFKLADALGCTDSMTIEISDSEGVEILDYQITGTQCAADNGKVVLTNLKGNPTQFTINANASIGNPLFENLKAGDYQIIAESVDCADTLSLTIAASTKPKLAILNFDGTSCGEDNGEVALNTTDGNGSYEYNLDEEISTDGLFTNLSAGTYTAYVEDLSSCLDSTEVGIANSERASLMGTTTNGTCGELGSVQLSAIGGGTNYEYALEDNDFLTTTKITNLTTGTYTFYLRSEEQCLDTLSLFIENYSKPVIEITNSSPAICGEPNGYLFVDLSQGMGELELKWQEEAFGDQLGFTDLAPDIYTLVAKDESDCQTTLQHEVTSTPPIELSDVADTYTLCETNQPQLDFTITGGTGKLDTFLIYPSGDTVSVLQPIQTGTYTLRLRDTVGCEAETSLVIEQDCSIYIPTAFSPTSFPPNDQLKIFVEPGHTIEILSFKIFDRWGTLVYDQSNIDPFTFTDWWDGSLNGQTVSTGVYVYMITYQENGKKGYISDTITVLREN